MLVLRDRWPGALPIPDLETQALGLLRDRGQTGLSDDRQSSEQLANDLLHSYTVNAVEFHTWQADFTLAPGDAPCCSRLARYLMEHALPVVNQRHEFVRLDFFTRQVGLLADGSRSRRRLLDSLVALAGKGELEIRLKGRRLTEESEIRRTVENTLGKALNALARLALLQG